MGLCAPYRQRHPERTALYQCLEDYWKEFKESYASFYEKEYGPWRPVVEKNVQRFLECGLFQHGFARIRCDACGSEYLLAYSCKTRFFCPSCQAKRVAAFVEWASEEVLEEVDHRQLVWTIPKALPLAFRRDRKLLGELCRCAWKSLREYVECGLGPSYVPGAIFAIQTWGDQLNHHPHLQGLVSERAWNQEGLSLPLDWVDSAALTQLFQHHVLEMMVSKRRLSPEFARKLCSWQHSGFQVYCGRPVEPEDQLSVERLAAYILRPTFAGTRVRYNPEDGPVEYRTTKGLTRRMDALDGMALVTSHIPDHHEHLLRYYGRYSNVSRGKRRKRGLCVTVQSALSGALEEDSEAACFSRQRRRSWARLLKKIYEVDPLTCPRCGRSMRIIAGIEDPPVIRNILQHLNLWERPQRSPPPRLSPQKLEAFLASLTPQQAQQVRVSTDAIFWDDVPVFNG